jgi:hypothetical protein
MNGILNHHIHAGLNVKTFILKEKLNRLI